ncbi:hypothetical protein SAMN04490207_5450 [Pseudomonas gessardii]|nr:hypothetical protein BLL38_12325 [Pseudomonas gessardii]SDR35216.1 hypothetical protein SAMN04490207_5450 [Pseudomonas gessardii]
MQSSGVFMPAARVILGQAVARQEPAVSEPAGDAATVKTLFSELLGNLRTSLQLCENPRNT